MKPNQGLSLIEVLVALAVCTTVTLIAASLAVSSANLKSLTSDRLEGGVLLQTLADSLLVAPSTDPRLTAGTHSQGYDNAGNPVASGALYNLSWTVTVNNPTVNMIRIDLNLNWTANGVVHNVPYVSLKNISAGGAGLVNVISPGG